MQLLLVPRIRGATVAVLLWAVACIGLGSTSPALADERRTHEVDNTLKYPMLAREQFTPDPPRDDEDMRKIKRSLYDAYLSQARTMTIPDAASLLASISTEGKWPDIRYSVREGRSANFAQADHLRRLHRLAGAYQDPKHSLHKDPKLGEAIVRGLDLWIELKPQSENSWFQTIGVPQLLLPTLILMESDLGRQRIDRAIPIVVADDLSGSGKPGSWNLATGTNLTWIARINIEAAALSEDAYLLARAARRFEQEIKLTELEGIQPDFSYTQHGRQLNTVGYAKSFVGDTIRMAQLLEGTRFAVSPAKLELLADFIIDGQQWMMRGGRAVTGAEGRGVARNPGKFVPDRGSHGEQLAVLLPDRANVLAAAGKHMRASPDANPLVGNRHFWRVDVMAHHRPGWAAVLRMASKRVIGTETGNGENLLSHHASDGVMETLITGDEYRTLLPLWNWRQLPGTTVIQTTGPLPLHEWGKDAEGTTDFVGGASDGDVGVAVLHHDRDGLTARKSWFFLDDRIVALGSSIDAKPNASAEPAYTTVEQCLSKGRVVIYTDSGRTELPPGKSLEFDGPLTLWHGPVNGDSGGTTYDIPAGHRVHTSHEKRSGSWHTINTGQTKDIVTADVFTLLIDHGPRPSDAQFAYTVLPGTSEPSHPVKSSISPVIAEGIHALHAGDGTSFIIFWTPGKYSWPGHTLTVDKPCAIIVSGDKLVVSDPSAKLKSVNIEWAAENRREQLHVELPQGPIAGQSVVAK